MKRRSGFTLVELIVVIMILGILAAVAAPRFFDAAGTATDNGVKQSLAVVRDAIALYQADQGGLPTDPPVDLAPYLRGGKFPTSPVGSKDALVNVVTGTGITADAIPTKRWKYSSTSAEFICNSDEATNTDPTVQYDQL